MFVYEPFLLKLSLNANIVKMQIFHKIKYDLRGHSRSQIMTFLIKKSPFLLFMLLLEKNKCRWTLWKNKVWLLQRRHLPCFFFIYRHFLSIILIITIINRNKIKKVTGPGLPTLKSEVQIWKLTPLFDLNLLSYF